MCVAIIFAATKINVISMGVYQFERKLSFTAKEFFIATILCVFILTQAGCGNREQHPDVSDIHIELQTRRLDRDLAYLDTNYIGQGLQQLKEIYPDFLDFYPALCPVK